MLLCPVRNCHLPLSHEGQRLVCAQGHSFDIARSGYINLLQPQERRSKQPGDAVEAVAGRRRMHDLGATAPLLHGISEIAKIKADDVVLDAGCGDGFYLGKLMLQTGCKASGIDISIPAIEAAARRYPGGQWIVANADRQIPYSDETFTCILSITARMNTLEFHRVLRNTGRLLIAIPAPEDLIELRGTGRDRVERTIETFSPQFKLSERQRVTTASELDASAVEDVLHSIYRPLQAKPAVATRVTFSLDLLLFRPA